MYKGRKKNKPKSLRSNRRLRRRVEKLFEFKTDKKKIYYFFILCLMLTALLLIRWRDEELGVGLLFKSEQNLLSPIYSTPIWLEDSLVAVATHSGTLIWYDISAAKIVSKIQVHSEVKAPLLKLDVNNDKQFEVIIPTLNESYGVYESMGHYLFKGREESPIKSLIAKPAVFKDEETTYLLLVDQEGLIELIESSYGRKIWQVKLNLQENENIVSSPVLYLNEYKYAFISATKGNCFAIDLLTGQIHWQKQIGEGFISTGVVSKSDFSLTKDFPVWSLLDVDGQFFQVNALTGEVTLKQEIKTGATSSVAGFNDNGQDHFVCLGQNGSVQLFSDGRWKQLYHSLEDGPFQASPILSDISGDKTLEIIAVHSSGKVVIVDLKGELLGNPYYLNAEITATPLLIPIQGKNYLMIATESGGFQNIIIKNKKNKISHSYLEFLHNERNNYFL